MQTDMGNWWRSRWWTPLFSLGLGAVMFTAFAIGGNASDGAKAFAVTAAVAIVFLIGGTRSETLSGIGGSERDERWQAIDLRASAFSGLVVILAAAGAWLYELAEGEDGSPYGQLLAVGGLAYILGVAFLRWRG
jgi:multisubunit Na+/H+ antiporter MnhB subunit